MKSNKKSIEFDLFISSGYWVIEFVQYLDKMKMILDSKKNDQ